MLFRVVIRCLGQVRALAAFRAVPFIICSGVALIAPGAVDFRQVRKLLIDIRPGENELSAIVEAAFDFQADKKRCGSLSGIRGGQPGAVGFLISAQYECIAAVCSRRLVKVFQ